MAPAHSHASFVSFVLMAFSRRRRRPPLATKVAPEYSAFFPPRVCSRASALAASSPLAPHQLIAARHNYCLMLAWAPKSILTQLGANCLPAPPDQISARLHVSPITALQQLDASHALWPSCCRCRSAINSNPCNQTD